MSIGSYVKGDSINWECSLGVDITNWKIRCEIYDDGYSIKLATANSGGADSQIEVTEATKGVFLIKVPKDETNCFCDKEANIEIEVENNESPTQIFTPFQDKLELLDQKITWEDPTA